MEADDDDPRSFHETDPQVAAVPEVGREDPDEASFASCGVLRAQEVLRGEFEQLQTKILAGPLQIAQPIERIGSDLDSVVVDRTSKA
jgi:hypothetical protein